MCFQTFSMSGTRENMITSVTGYLRVGHQSLSSPVVGGPRAGGSLSPPTCDPFRAHWVEAPRLGSYELMHMLAWHQAWQKAKPHKWLSCDGDQEDCGNLEVPPGRAHQQPVMVVEEKVTQRWADIMGLLFLKIQKFNPVETGGRGRGRAEPAGCHFISKTRAAGIPEATP